MADSSGRSAAAGDGWLARQTGREPLISVVIPVRDEEDSICPLIEELIREFTARAFTAYEIVVVDDGSVDGTVGLLRQARGRVENLRIVRLRHARGQSAAICAGVTFARAAWIATLDGDGQNDPADILRLWQEAGRRSQADRPVLVIGDRAKRRDPRGKLATSWVLNRLVAFCLGHDVADRGSGLKVFRRADFLLLPSFDHMHRFLPALFQLIDGQIVSVAAAHRPRRSGTSHYRNLARVRETLADIVGISWLRRRLLYFCCDEEP